MIHAFENYGQVRGPMLKDLGLSCIGVLSHLPPVSTWPVSISFKRFISKHREW